MSENNLGENSSPKETRTVVVTSYTNGYTHESLFEKVLKGNNINFKTTLRSIYIEYCPVCGKKWKVWCMKPADGDGRTGGRCWSCSTRFSSVSLLIALLGISSYKANRMLEIGLTEKAVGDPETWKLPSLEPEPEYDRVSITLEEASIPDDFFLIKDYSTHTIAKYAQRRGVMGDIAEQVFMSVNSASVAFPVMLQDMLVGFQRRFISPFSAKRKAKIDSGLPTSFTTIPLGKNTNPLCVVEGPFDAVAMNWFGFHSIALIGKEITQGKVLEIISQLQYSNYDKVYIALDSDVVGENAARKVARILDMYGISTVRLRPSESKFKDPGDIVEGVIKEYGLTNFIPLDLEDFFDTQDNWAWDLPELKLFDVFNFDAKYMEQEEVDDLGLSSRNQKNEAKREIIRNKILRLKTGRTPL